jgi:hypothetical protein
MRAGGGRREEGREMVDLEHVLISIPRAAFVKRDAGPARMSSKT